jgi:hypothetical protein
MILPSPHLFSERLRMASCPSQSRRGCQCLSDLRLSCPCEVQMNQDRLSQASSTVHTWYCLIAFLLMTVPVPTAT